MSNHLMTWLNWPNRITIARILFVVPLVICLLNINHPWPGWRHTALGLFAIMAVSDGLDGFLARRLREETPLGKFLDPVADKLLIICAVVILSVDETAVPHYTLPNWVAVIAIGKDALTILGFALVYATTGQFFIHPRVFGKACTLVQLTLIAWVLGAPDLPRSLARALPAGWWMASALAVMAAVDYLRIGNRFAADFHRRQQETNRP